MEQNPAPEETHEPTRKFFLSLTSTLTPETGSKEDESKVQTKISSLDFFTTKERSEITSCMLVLRVSPSCPSPEALKKYTPGAGFFTI